MNMAITHGLVLMPTPFAAGLSVWSRGDGTPGSDTYAGAGGGLYVPADQDFGGCMEIVKTATLQKVRYMGDTPVQPGLYLRITARVKAVAGPLPEVRIAGWPGRANGTALPGVTVVGPPKALTAYGEVVEVQAIVGPGLRGGVDMTWHGAAFGHFGIDLTGANGGVVRIDDIQIEDITHAFLGGMLSRVDVRDYGARGDGVTNDAPAFLAADAAAAGREILVPAGTYFLGANVTLMNRPRFEGTVTQGPGHMFILRGAFNYPAYAEAFGDEEIAIRKAFQALVNFSDHDGLDLCGRRIALNGPLDLQAADPSKTSFAVRRVIRNGQFQPAEGGDWADHVVTSTATYAAGNASQLTNVANIANIRVGSLVTGNGVGREVYVTSVNVAQARLTLSAELYDAQGSQTFTFRRFKYLLDFSGFDVLNSFILSDIEFFCEGRASGVMLAKQGIGFTVKDCVFTKPKDRGLTSIGSGCQGLLLDRCQFLSNEQDLNVNQRDTIAFNANANDVKIRECRVVLFKHFCVLQGSGSLITSNHWFHGDGTTNGVRKGGLIFTRPNPKTMITGNHIDNNFIEWTNEHDATPSQDNQFSFGGLTLTGNVFTASDVASWFNWLVIKPHGPGHFVHGLSVVGNVFRALNGNVDRIEHVDTTHADLDYGRMRNVVFAGNVCHGVNQEARNPAQMVHEQSTASRTWAASTGTYLPFLGRARIVEAVVPQGAIRNATNQIIYENPHVETEFGADRRQYRLIFSTPCTGTVRTVVRMDNPY